MTNDAKCKAKEGPVLYIVIPCYNEEKVLPVTEPLFLKKIKDLVSAGEISDESRVLFVDDGSRDRTWELICRFHDEDSHITGIRQSRNRGHQNALLSGLMEVKEICDISISIDCDGQDDINAMDEMIRCYKGGSEVVYGVRSSRETDSFFKRFTAQSFYRILRGMGAELVYNHADYRLISGRVLRELAGYREVNIFLRGLVPLVGFQSSSVYYERHERMAGKSHYPLKKMLALAVDGITSLSVQPIRLITCMGFLISLASVFAIIWVIIGHFMGNTTDGWSSTVCAIFFMGGVQLLSLGVIGEYIGKIYLETKQRPRYIISERAGLPECERAELKDSERTEKTETGRTSQSESVSTGQAESVSTGQAESVSTGKTGTGRTVPAEAGTEDRHGRDESPQC